MKNEKTIILGAGAAIGVIASVLVLFGNPVNMGFCIACFIRDTAGALGMHRAAPVQYIRPEIIGIILGSTAMALLHREFASKGGSAPMTRFVLGFFAMVGCLMFLGCPFRMIVRLAGGDLNAVLGLIGFFGGVLTGVFFLNKGYSLKRTYRLAAWDGYVLPAAQVVFLILLIAGPAFIFFSEEGPGSKHAFWLVSLLAGAAVGALAQRTRLCMAGGLRDVVLFRDYKLILGFVAVFGAALATNLVLGLVSGTSYISFGFAGQPVAHTDGLWNLLGMYLVGFAAILLGGCPLRQLVLSGEGNVDSQVTYLGLLVSAAFCHNFGLASSGEGPTANGKIGVAAGICVCLAIACLNTFRKGEK